ncbi:putative bifunctional diguanylate cyclase/phosphodiesterase [Brevundimonas subvibrioides]|uniref:putative bifunctional diguanylate cyclase/phosphodiesterase n=1 Tax=Brevundimonas subvibrioides TaxID=74313 RepID=UPI0022B36EE0|nr:EAL domain-containing protein [Brevundimonas subvibrioides]
MSIWRKVWVRNFLGTTLILATVATATILGWLLPMDDLFAGARFRSAPNIASGGLTVVEIDARSLEQAGTWPWERERYATAIDRLIAAGATLVVFDVDFSAASDAASDDALARTISNHPGQVALSAFVQNRSFAASDRGLTENRPIASLTQDALIASVNIPVDQDGRVRHYAYASPPGGQASIAATLAGRSGRGEFAIDYGIDQRTIPHLSFGDVLAGRFDPALVNGRVILVGATALELGDEFATPVGLVPGVVIHALAYESIVKGRALMTPGPVLMLVFCLGLGLLLLPQRDAHSLRVLLIRHGFVSLGILGLPILVQVFWPISLNIAPLLATQILFAIWATRAELFRRGRAIIREREAGLLHLAMHHTESELPNRRALLKAIEDERASGESASVVVLGIGRLPEMRGLVGYDVTNTLIQRLAARMADVTGAHCVAHVSSSALAGFVPGLTREELEAVVSRLKELETNFNIDGHSIDIYPRLGAARSEAADLNAELLIERATLALSKASGTKTQAVIYDENADGSPANNLALMTEMLAALESGDICLVYQPKMQTRNGAITSVEALCRWNHPERGFISPDVFIPIAEETGRIRALTEWCFVTAIKHQATLSAAGRDVTIALNVSGRLLSDMKFKTMVLELTRSVEASLCLEITETAVIDNPALAAEAIAAFRGAGLKISIDDYGAGLSSLGYLKQLDADELKIDRSLVVELTGNQRDRMIMKSTIDLAHGLGMEVVAEGVEDALLATCLAQLGCDMIQGYWLSKPLALPDLQRFLQDRDLLKPGDRQVAA